MSDRKTIFKAIVGSKLYGTDHPLSDDDFLGVFLPNRKDLLGTQTPPSELTENVKESTTDRNQKGDVDSKLLSLRHFFKMLLQGQSGAVELLFVPESKILFTTPEWAKIVAHKDLFLSRSGVLPIIGFALAQSHKSSIKGANLNLIRRLIKDLTPYAKGATKVRDVVEIFGETYLMMKGGAEVRYTEAVDGTKVVDVASRMFNLGATVKNFVTGMQKMEEKYGSRSEIAAGVGVDTKSLCHAYRLLFQAEEYLLHGTISFPRPEAPFLKDVRHGRYQADFREEISSKVDYLKKEIMPKSPLPEKPNFKKSELLHIEMVGEVL
jgi:hypothetical protein